MTLPRSAANAISTVRNGGSEGPPFLKTSAHLAGVLFAV